VAPSQHFIFYSEAPASVYNLGRVDEPPIGILYEHPLWLEPLFAELDRRGVPTSGFTRKSSCSTPASASFRSRSC
jgi:hypothetical protein